MAYDVKTLPQDGGVAEFLSGVEPPRRREQGFELLAIFGEVTAAPAVLWGPSMIGYGDVTYRYESGHGGRTYKVGFSPRKAHLVLYGLDWYGSAADLLDRLGPHKRGKSCVYVTNLDHVDHEVLRALIRRAWESPSPLPAG